MVDGLVVWESVIEGVGTGDLNASIYLKSSLMLHSAWQANERGSCSDFARRDSKSPEDVCGSGGRADAQTQGNRPGYISVPGGSLRATL